MACDMVIEAWVAHMDVSHPPNHVRPFMTWDHRQTLSETWHDPSSSLPPAPPRSAGHGRRSRSSSSSSGGADVRLSVAVYPSTTLSHESAYLRALLEEHGGGVVWAFRDYDVRWGGRGGGP